MKIRNFKYTDIDQLIKLAKTSFAEEAIAQGMTPESFVNQLKFVTRGRMIPFKMVTALTRVTWGFFVAEVEGEVVGCGGYLGQKNIELANLMVAPEYRRRGIGQELLIKRLDYLTKQGYPFVTTTILATNQSSLGNVQKQDFEVFERYSVFEIPIPIKQQSLNGAGVVARPVQESDQLVFNKIEQQTIAPLSLQIYGSATPRYFPGFGAKLASKFYGTQTWTRSFENNNKLVGFLSMTTSPKQEKGILSGPRISNEYVKFFPAMLSKASAWLIEHEKTAMQITIPDSRTQLIEDLQKQGWVKVQSWVKLIKWLDESARPAN